MKKYVKKHWLPLMLAVFFGLMEVVFIYFSTIKVGEIIESILHPSEGNMVWLMMLSFVFVAGAFFSNYISFQSGQTFTINIVQDLRMDYVRKMLKMPSSLFFQEEGTHYINDLDPTMEQLRTDYLLNIPNTLAGILQTVFYLGGIYLIHPILMFITLALIVLPSLIGKIFSKKISQYQMERAEKNQIFTEKLLELIRGYLSIKQSKSQSNFAKDFSDASGDLLDRRKKLNVSRNMLFQSMFSMNIISVILIVFVGSVLVSRGELEIGRLVTSITLISVATNAIAETFKYAVELYSSRGIKEKVMLNKNETNSKIQKDDIIPELPMVCEELGYSFGERSIFKNLNLAIENRESCAIIGPSGSGKSTFVKILMAINGDYQGEIQFSNGELSHFSEEGLYKLIYYIPQNPYVFTDTLMNNVTMKKEVDREKVEKILQHVGLFDLYHDKKDEVIKPDTLSGGEKKKLEIARAMYVGREFLIFDEPTSNLDPISKEIIEDLIFSLKEFTRLVITHNQDIDYLKRFDHVLNLEKFKS